LEDSVDIGVWMSRGVLQHKRDTDCATQVWNLHQLPEGFIEAPGPHRLFVAVDGHWRGFFRLLPPVMQNDQDRTARFTLAFDPITWIPVLPESAPPRERDQGFTVTVPTVGRGVAGTRVKNEREERDLLSLLEREEERE